MSVLPGGGARYVPARVHQDAEAVAGGLMTLHWFVEPSLSAVWYKHSVVLVLPRLFQGRLPFLVT